MEKKKDRTREKGKSGGRGSGKKMFIANEDELVLREREFQEERGQRNKRRGEEETETTNNKDEEEEDDNEQQNEGEDSVFAFDRKPKTESTSGNNKEGEGEEPTNLLSRPDIRNPNHAKKQADPNDPAQGANRKEREALAAVKAKEDYMRRHLAGETEQAQKELAMLALVRARREAAKQKREAEGRPAGWTAHGVEESSSDSSDEEEKPAKPAAAATVSAVAAKKKAAAAGDDEAQPAADGGPPKVKAMDIKKMSGDQLKDHLKARNLDIQGQKKDLVKRLCDYEAARA